MPRIFICIFQSASYISNNTDDDDISAFVQDIDARKPLRRALSDRRRHPLGANPELAVDFRSRPHGVLRDGSPAAGINSEPSNPGINGIGEPMLTNASDIDQRLKKMNDAFSARLAGLSGTAPSPRTSRGGLDRDRSASRERVLTMRRALESYDPLSRHRRSSMGSVRSGLSIGSEEVIGKLELDDKRKGKGV
jgi:hypothetical protein